MLSQKLIIMWDKMYTLYLGYIIHNVLPTSKILIVSSLYMQFSQLKIKTKNVANKILLWNSFIVLSKESSTVKCIQKIKWSLYWKINKYMISNIHVHSDFCVYTCGFHFKIYSLHLNSLEHNSLYLSSW